MKQVFVKSLPLKDVLSDLAEAFGVPYHENCKQYYLRLPPEVGKGTIKGINFKHGLGILQYDCTFYEDVEILFVINNIHPLKLLFCMDGEFQHRFENDKAIHVIETYHNAIVASSKHHGHILKFKKDTYTAINSVEIAREVFISRIECDLGHMDPGLQKLFRDCKAKEPFYYNGTYSYKMAEILEEMNQFAHEDLLKKIFLQGKSYEILTHQILQYQDDLRSENEKYVLRKSEIKLIEQAAEDIRENIESFQGIESLSATIGLNQKKIQIGFKALFKMTVNTYVQKVRMDMAKKLLLNTDLSISEICYKLGINSVSYLSKLFKEQYNLTPTEFRLRA
ncbi:helix-turn-helix transcriptional regulator [Aquimarina sp. ERC-38]|uniref:helix-turn-helix domain-containing protein n=1 Tax=Aquimarina sp. ERC-38 TaxID=2949996 RepID=UPI002247B318|nr:helix-turn-helix domain-containing protein [Aquimarina sp. ERC-38]UZO80872.1 helix-turn-helix transcriptional regulator [Aquimarina sp. ERC-38]